MIVVENSGTGVQVNYRGLKIALDPHRAPDADIAFISHAHIDHIHNPRGSARILTSKETSFLAKERGYELGEIHEEIDGLQMIDSGHILGSRGLNIFNEIFYTGDFALRPRAFLDRGRTVKCRVLIIEATFGRSEYRFPTTATILERTNRLISDLFSRGTPLILMGYPLGKAQILTHLFSSWEPTFLHASVARMNEAHVKRGVEMKNGVVLYTDAQKQGLLEKKPWILISPMQSDRTDFIKALKRKYGAVTIAFSGWSVNSSFKYAMGVDYTVPLSDHCDFLDLLELVKKCSPEEVFTIHGFASEFAKHLWQQGYDAKPLKGVQKSISDYFKYE
jgi:putative mRNA 3-end processing factor